jgi:hypothetical protein
MATREQTHKNNTLRNNRGSTLLPMLMLSMVMAVTALSVMSSFTSRQRLQAHAQAIQVTQNLETNVRMLFASREVCKTNLNAGSLGATVDNMKALSQQKKLALSYSVIGSGAPAKVSVNNKWENVTVKEIYFKDMVNVDNSTTFLGTLIITVADHYGAQVKSIELPFYVTSDASGNLTDCFASSFPLGTDSHITMEDMLCQQGHSASDVYYSPSEHTCVRNAAVLDARVPVVVTSR